MARARKKRRGGTLVVRVERAGHRVLCAVWSLGVRVLLVPLVAMAGWIERQRAPVALVVVAALLAAGGLGVHRLTREPPAPVITDDVEALARVIRSEIGIGTEQQKLHVAWTTRNLAESRGQGVAEMACTPCGPQERGRPVSSRQRATDADRALARLVVAADPRLDPTGGATHFLNPALQDELARRGVPGYRNRPYRAIRRIWTRSYGWEPYYRLGPDLELWGDPR